MEIVILAPEDVDVSERDVQAAFEGDLSKLEDGLLFLQSEVVVGTGRIDTLAIDTDTGEPVFIEYKRRGQFGKDALIQLMEYLSWFTRDENRLKVLERLVRQHKPDLVDFEPRIRLICVATDIDDQVRNAIYAVANPVKVFSYMIARDTAQKLVLVPRLEVDNGEVEPVIPESTTEAALLAAHPQFQELVAKLKVHLLAGGAVTYARGNSLRYKSDRLFAKLHFRKKYIQLELQVGKRKVEDPAFKYWRQGGSPWGYTRVFPSQGISEKLIQWIDLARAYAAETGVDEDEEESPV